MQANRCLRYCAACHTWAGHRRCTHKVCFADKRARPYMKMLEKKV